MLLKSLYISFFCYKGDKIGKKSLVWLLAEDTFVTSVTPNSFLTADKVPQGPSASRRKLLPEPLLYNDAVRYCTLAADVPGQFQQPKAPPPGSPCLQLDNISGKRNRTWWCWPRLCDRAGAPVPRLDETDLEGQWGPRLLGQEGRVSHHWFSLIVSGSYNFQDESRESIGFYKNVIVKGKINWSQDKEVVPTSLALSFCFN